MLKRTLSLLYIVLAVCGAATAQQDSNVAVYKPNGLRISLLTCGVGDYVYETFGHTAVRVIDSSAVPPFNDKVYNYGMFNGYDENFELKFMRGKLRYYVSTEFFGDFMEAYYEYGRSVHEQVLTMSDQQKREIKEYLDINVLPQNRYYKYDFFFDNCATRIRDIFPTVIGKDFVYGATEAVTKRITFRDIMNRYFYRRHWERTGVNILLGSRIDKVMTNEDIMFLPAYLSDGLAAATVAGKPFSSKPEELLPDRQGLVKGPNMALMLCAGLMLLTLITNVIAARVQWPARIVNALMLIISGLLGVIILFMWFGTDHQGCSDNYNILWALPTNLVLAFSRRPGRGRYALIALVLCGISMLLPLMKVQGTIPELLLLQLGLIIVYVSIWRKQGKVAIKEK